MSSALTTTKRRTSSRKINIHFIMKINFLENFPTLFNFIKRTRSTSKRKWSRAKVFPSSSKFHKKKIFYLNESEQIERESGGKMKFIQQLIEKLDEQSEALSSLPYISNNSDYQTKELSSKSSCQIELARRGKLTSRLISIAIMSAVIHSPATRLRLN